METKKEKKKIEKNKENKNIFSESRFQYCRIER